MKPSVYVAPQNRQLVAEARSWLKEHDRQRQDTRTVTIKEISRWRGVVRYGEYHGYELVATWTEPTYEV